MRLRHSFLLLLMLLAGCVSLEPLPGAGERADLELRGRVAYRYAGEGGSATIAWRHAGSFDDLLITGPLGQGIARIDRRDQSFVLTTVDGKQFRANDAESLTEAALGWRLPLAGLPDWVLGQPIADRSSHVERDESGRISRIDQDDWRIDYLAWNEAGPARISLHRDAEAGRSAIELRLVIDQLSRGSK